MVKFMTLLAIFASIFVRLSAQELDSKKTVFHLEATYKGPSPLYPGQRGILIYRIYFNTSIELTLSKLPFLEAKGFQKIGDIRIRETEKEGLSLQEIEQEIEAVSPGTFHLGPSIIEGNKQNGTKETLRSEAPELALVVAPFPKENRPISFNGAVGTFSLKSNLISPSEVILGDKIQMIIEITGKGNLSNIRLPNLLCQPGFSGLFSLNDLPPAGDVEENSKRFVVELRPRSLLIEEIPSIQFSYFDPIKKSYYILHSPPIPIKVRQIKIPSVLYTEHVEDSMEPPWHQSLSHLAPIDIDVNFTLPLSTTDEKSLTVANQNYIQGIDAKTLWERKLFINEALLSYSLIATRHASPLLDFNIANCYYLLKEYAWAILYYNRALKSLPDFPAAINNLHLSQTALNIPTSDKPTSILEKIISSNSRWPLRLKLGLFFISASTSIILVALWIWSKKKWIKKVCFSFIGIASFFLCSLSLTWYVEPIEGVLVIPSHLYQSASANALPIAKEILLPGIKVQVIDSLDRGHWIKVITSSGQIGYLPHKTIRII